MGRCTDAGAATDGRSVFSSEKKREQLAEDSIVLLVCDGFQSHVFEAGEDEVTRIAVDLLTPNRSTHSVYRDAKQRLGHPPFSVRSAHRFVQRLRLEARSLVYVRWKQQSPSGSRKRPETLGS